MFGRLAYTVLKQIPVHHKGALLTTVDFLGQPVAKMVKFSPPLYNISYLTHALRITNNSGKILTMPLYYLCHPY